MQGVEPHLIHTQKVKSSDCTGERVCVIYSHCIGRGKEIFSISRISVQPQEFLVSWAVFLCFALDWEQAENSQI